MNHYRYFPKDVVIDCMIKTGIIAAEITGYNRMHDKGRTLIFETFTTLSDPVDYFAEAMNTELEHGSISENNVTNDDALMTAKIAAVHIKGIERDKFAPYNPFPSYYDWLLWVEKLHERALER